MTNECMTFGPLVFQSVGAAWFVAICLGIIAGILVSKRLRPVCRHEVSMNALRVDRPQFEDFMNSELGKKFLYTMIVSDPEFHAAIKKVMEQS